MAGSWKRISNMLSTCDIVYSKSIQCKSLSRFTFFFQFVGDEVGDKLGVLLHEPVTCLYFVNIASALFHGLQPFLPMELEWLFAGIEVRAGN
jgi:hypothetical protein